MRPLLPGLYLRRVAPSTRSEVPHEGQETRWPVSSNPLLSLTAECRAARERKKTATMLKPVGTAGGPAQATPKQRATSRGPTTRAPQTRQTRAMEAGTSQATQTRTAVGGELATDADVYIGPHRTLHKCTVRRCFSLPPQAQPAGPHTKRHPGVPPPPSAYMNRCKLLTKHYPNR